MSRKQRIIQVAGGMLILIVLGFAYLWFFLTFGTGLPCIFHKLTGLKCPGCGMTHAVAALWNGNIRQALDDNFLVLNVLPVTCLYLLYRAVRYVNGHEKGFYIWEYALLSLLLLLTVGYGLVRNLC
jgi:hypothetical protein